MIYPVALMLSLLLAPAPVPQAPGEKASDLIEVTMPTEWTRTEAGGLLTFAQRPTSRAGFRMVTALSSRPKTGSIRETFLQLWKTLAKGVSPDDPFEHHLVPLLMRNNKGVVVAFDGDSLRKKPLGLMLYVVDCGDSVVPILGMFGTDPPMASVLAAGDSKPTELAKTMLQMVNTVSLKKGKSAEGPLFRTSDLAGTYHKTLLASSAQYVNRSTGAITGDASTGGSFDYVFGSDGSYKETSALVVQGSGAGVSERKGSWKFDGDTVMIHYADGKSSDTKLMMMGVGLNRSGDKTIVYLADPRSIDKFFFQMFVEGSNASNSYYEKKAD